MNERRGPGGLILGSVKPTMPKITTYVAAELDVLDGGGDIGDATHMLAIRLPVQGEEIRIPCNARALRDLGAKCQQAGGDTQARANPEDQIYD